MAHMYIRNATIDDLPRIVEIYNSTVPGRMVTADTEPVTVTDKREWFHKHHHARPLWMVEEDGDAIGWASISDFYGRPAYRITAEISIYLDPAYRGRGFGRQILQYAISQCPALGIHNLLGFIFSHNEASLILFEKAGFSKWGELPHLALMDGKTYSLTIMGRKV